METVVSNFVRNAKNTASGLGMLMKIAVPPAAFSGTWKSL